MKVSNDKVLSILLFTRIAGSQTAPLNDEHAWRIMEDFLTTDMTYPKMEEVFLSYLGDRYADSKWKEARDALFSGDGDDNVALENLRAVKAKHISISPASCAPKDHSVMDRRLSQVRIRPTRRPAKVSEMLWYLYLYSHNICSQKIPISICTQEKIMRRMRRRKRRKRRKRRIAPTRVAPNRGVLHACQDPHQPRGSLRLSMVSLIELKIHSVMHLKITGLFPQYLS
jgi:hypothetical protein